MTFPEMETPRGLREQALELQRVAWPGLGGRRSHDPALRPVSMLLVEDGKVLASLDILSKEIVHAGVPYRAGGLSTVVAHLGARRQGHGRRLVRAARTAMAASGLDLGLFTCDRPLLPFYESAGWQHLPGTTLVGGTPSAPFPSDGPGFDKVTLGSFFTFTDHRSFVNARIDLYPGEIDKLW
ncbi:GNAT family N-acetyltransferase [Nonomuraea sp. NPDC046570]|uniref:GNAT family N-acetyltransferase n=1 Tax=Nonomuraea sp. NPDC046570 TaxID=3155255 RepID=UPI0033D8859B